jgi:DNA-binding NtrC family response regulator
MAMPFLDGPATIRALKRVNPTIRIVAMSGLMNVEQTTELESLNVRAFLTKPFTAEKLLTTLDGILNKNG